MTMPDILAKAVCGLDENFSLFCQGTDDGDDGAFIICCYFQDLSVMYDTGH